jgi:hypothetical protein
MSLLLAARSFPIFQITHLLSQQMALFTTPNLASLGSINVPGFISVPPLVNFIAEWAALIPLVCHLANYYHPHKLAGRVALLGRIRVAIFPKLGVLAGLSQLVERGPELFDIASTLGPSSRRVWDVKWGGSFPCANGAASSYLIESLMDDSMAATRIPESIPPMRPSSSLISATNSNSTYNSSTGILEKALPSLDQTSSTEATGHANFRRYQTLHVLHFAKTPLRSSWPSTLDKILSSATFTTVSFVFKLVLVIVFALFGIYGTAIILLCSSVTQLVCRTIDVRRPPGFLGNNEAHDACMLVATQQNASIWYLFVGDRGIVDSLLNKTMVAIPRQRFVAIWLRAANLVQLLAMTFVASEKGWDGVSLLTLLGISSIMQQRLQRKRVARIFCEDNGIMVKREIFEFSGRTPMLGAIQKLSHSPSWKWMDEILAPCPRREVWARGLSSETDDAHSYEEELSTLNDSDRKWAWMNRILAIRGVNLMQRAARGLAGERV